MGCPKIDGCCQACQERMEEPGLEDSIKDLEKPVTENIVSGVALLGTIVWLVAFIFICATILSK